MKPPTLTESNRISSCTPQATDNRLDQLRAPANFKGFPLPIFDTSGVLDQIAASFSAVRMPALDRIPMTAPGEEQRTLPVAPAVLPVEKYRAEILRKLADNDCLVISGETGCGKSSGVPWFLKEAGYAVIDVTQPRRIAATSLATFVADKNDATVGEEVGYAHAFDRKCSSRTVINYRTDGYESVLRLAKGFPERGVIVIDEFHEGRIAMDLLVALVREKQKEQRQRTGWVDLKLIVMSATLQGEELSDFLNGAPIVHIKGRPFPVEVVQNPPKNRYALAADIASRGENSLIFEPGKPEIQATIDCVEESLASREFPVQAAIFPLHAEQSYEDQKRALAPSETAKIVVATDVAKTSLTPVGIKWVLDSGLKKVVYNIGGIDHLAVEDVTLADASQAMGRVGRVEPGTYVYCGETPLEQLQKFGRSEIEREALAPLILRCIAAGKDVRRLEFFHRPPEDALQNGEQTLAELGLVSPTGHVTKLGERVLQLPVSLEAGRLVAAAELMSQRYPGILRAAISIAAIIEAQGIAETVAGDKKPWQRLCGFHGFEDGVPIRKFEQASDPLAQHLVMERVLGMLERKEINTGGLASLGIKAVNFEKALTIKQELIRRTEFRELPNLGSPVSFPPHVMLTHLPYRGGLINNGLALDPPKPLPYEQLREPLLICLEQAFKQHIFQPVSNTEFRGLQDGRIWTLSKDSVTRGELIAGIPFVLRDEDKDLNLITMATQINPDRLPQKLRREISSSQPRHKRSQKPEYNRVDCAQRGRFA